ncbi:uncharacterized protein NPIL_412611 [Nephila pilipes]|uniref:Uncharacterized protein n=1 Tax=Nephila pilipes TaxID=299642 RepID=A0A8X6TCZ4_NEPPI|nr:uncharacterized protein NPIL_412611 [Nephila pilipes]
MCISLADGQRSTEDVLITTETIEIEGRKFDQELIALPNAKRNRTLLGIDFLKKSGIMLDLKNQQWFFADMPQKQFAFGEHANDQHPVDNLDVNLCTLREEEDACKRAYASCVFVRSEVGNESKVTLIRAKNRVAPVKP